MAAQSIAQLKKKIAEIEKRKREQKIREDLLKRLKDLKRPAQRPTRFQKFSQKSRKIHKKAIRFRDRTSDIFPGLKQL